MVRPSDTSTVTMSAIRVATRAVLPMRALDCVSACFWINGSAST